MEPLSSPFPSPLPFPDATSIRSATASRSGSLDTARSHHRREVGNGNGNGNGEGGYTLVIVVLVIALMSILMAVAVQTVDFQMRREREAELIFRGEQYVEAIRLYRMKYGRYPMRMKEIWEANPRVVRKKWKDPITDSESWGLIFLGQGGRRIGAENPLGGTPSPKTVTYEDSGLDRGERDEGGMTGPDGEKTGPIVGVTYEATVQVSSTQADIGAWELTGQATVKASFDSDYESRLTTPLGPCNTHYTDKVPLTTFSGAVEGGLEIVEGFYQFHVSIPGFDGAISTAVRDDTGCAGGNTTETNPWPVAPVTVGGNGNVTSPSVISGSTIRPVDNGEDVTTWNLTRD